ncbi:MAG: hypothetical protein LBG58_03210, partial [Planctomycetaceae bacterium]|nr:hypothetical protein [Planctomycetaceae bacterium]
AGLRTLSQKLHQKNAPKQKTLPFRRLKLLATLESPFGARRFFQSKFLTQYLILNTIWGRR